MQDLNQSGIDISPSARGARARENFLAGYGCAQAVLLAFEDVTGLDRTVAASMASSFGGGMGRMREVCGAFSGAILVLGLVSGYSDPQDVAGKSRHYARVRELAARFRDRCTVDGRTPSIVCRDLLVGASVPAEVGGEAEVRTTAYYRKRPCPELCAMAAEILQEMLQEI